MCVGSTTKKLFFDDSPIHLKVFSTPLCLLLLSAVILQDHQNQHQVSSFQVAGGVPLFLVGGHPWCSPLAPPFKPEAQKVVYKVKQNPARRGMGVHPCHPKKKNQAKSTNKKWMVGKMILFLVVFFVVAYFQVLFCC